LPAAPERRTTPHYATVKKKFSFYAHLIYLGMASYINSLFFPLSPDSAFAHPFH
jgi:hypothetical protein